MVNRCRMMIDRYLVNGSLHLRWHRLRFITVNTEHWRSCFLFCIYFSDQFRPSQKKKRWMNLRISRKIFIFGCEKKTRFDFNFCFIITSTHQANEQIKYIFCGEKFFLHEILIYQLGISVHWWEATPSVLLLITK